MTFTLTIDCDNAAFEDPFGPGGEVARILRYLAADLIDDSLQRGNLLDINGNTVGRFEFTS